MGKKNKKNAQPIQQTHAMEKRERRCDWCRIPHTEGSMWEGHWVCTDCFNPDALEKKKQEEKKRQEAVVRKCDSCQGSGKHKNKYAHFSQVDKYQTGGYIEVIEKPKPKRKNRHPRLKKIIYWVVVITDISDGKL